MKKRILSLIAGVAALALVLTGCSSSGSNGGSGQTTLTVWGWLNQPAWMKLVQSYSAPGVKVVYRNFQSTQYDKQLETGLASSSGPDLFMTRSYGGLTTLAAGGKVAALPSDFAGFKNISKNLISGFTSNDDGKIYAMPVDSVTANIIYNKAMFAKYGLHPPTTWKQFIALNDTLKSKGVVPMAATAKEDWILPIYRDMFGASEYGGPKFAQDLLSGKAKFTDPGYTAANQTLKNLAPYFPKGYTGMAYADGSSLFESGQAAMYPGGIWELQGIEQAMKGTELGLFNVPRQVGTGAPYVMGYLDSGMGMSAALTGAKKTAAEGFLSWVGSKKFAQPLADSIGLMPCVSGVVPRDPLLAGATKGFAENPTPFLSYVYFNYGTPSGLNLEYADLQKMMLGQMTPAQVGQAVQSGVSQWFKPKSANG